MSYVRQSLSRDEQLIHIGRFHWMYTVGAIMSIVWGIIGAIVIVIGAVKLQPYLSDAPVYYDGWLSAVRGIHPGAKLFAFLAFVMGMLGFAQKMIIKATTEIAVTTSRLIYKRGLVARYVGEMSIDRIEGVNVLQSILGRMLGYGRIMVRGMGVGEVILPPLEKPIIMRKAIERARTS